MYIRRTDHATPLYPQKLALTSLTSGGRSVGIVRSRTKAMKLVYHLLNVHYRCYINHSNLYSRIGRSGRFGRKGVAINFVKSDDIRILRDIEQYYSTQIDEMPMNGK
jgi:hypothetical protein